MILLQIAFGHALLLFAERPFATGLTAGVVKG